MKTWKQQQFPVVKHIPVVKQTQITEVCWHTGTPRVTNCELVEKQEYEIHLPIAIHSKIEALSKEVNNLEWLGYLLGKVNEKGDSFLVEDIEIPEQEVTAGSVDVLVPSNKPEVIGTVHLHPGTGDGFLSGTDETYIGGNHAVTISYNHSGKYRAVVKHTLPCHASILVDAKVLIDTPAPQGLTEFVLQATEKIKQRVYTQQFVGYSADEGYYPTQQYVGIACSICKVVVSYSLLTWSQGIARCPSCQKKYADG